MQRSRFASSLLFFSLCACGVQGAPATPADAKKAALATPPDSELTSCEIDDDCVAVPRAGCCDNGWKEAVNADQVDAYYAANPCEDPHPICPLYYVDDTRVPICSLGSCSMVEPGDVRCGGFVLHPHACTDGYTCVYGPIPDVAGICEPQDQACGGGGQIECSPGEVCRPNPRYGPCTGPRCPGLCQTCIQTVLCVRGSHFDRQTCACVPNCIQTIFCVIGSHFDREACTCLPD